MRIKDVEDKIIVLTNKMKNNCYKECKEIINRNKVGMKGGKVNMKTEKYGNLRLRNFDCLLFRISRAKKNIVKYYL